MSLDIKCPNCGEAATVPDDSLYRGAQCNVCESRFFVKDAVLWIPPRRRSAPSRDLSSEQKKAITVIGVFTALIALVIAFNSRSSDSGLSTPPPLSSRPEPSAFRYDDSSDADLKRLPSLRGYSDAEKEHIISEAKKLDAALKELERERGF